MRARSLPRAAIVASALALGACSAEPPVAPAMPTPNAPPRDTPASAAPPQASAVCPPVPSASARPRQRDLLPFTAAVLRFERRFSTPTLLSSDGRTLAVWEPNRVGTDEAGVYLTSPHAHLTIVDVDGDRVVDTLRLTEKDAFKDEAAVLARVAVVERAFTARRWEEVPAYHLEPDPAAPARSDDDAPQAMIARGEGLTVSYREPTLTVIDDGGATLLRRDFPGWTMSALLPKAGPRCVARGVMTGLSGRRARGILLVELGYDGRCPYWGASHVVRLGT
jgi:hypothetical protein